MNIEFETWNPLLPETDHFEHWICLPIGETDGERTIEELDAREYSDDSYAQQLTATHFAIAVTRPEHEGDRDMKTSDVTWWDFGVFLARKVGEGDEATFEIYCEDTPFVWYQSTYTYEEAKKVYDLACEMAKADMLLTEEFYKRVGNLVGW